MFAKTYIYRFTRQSDTLVLAFDRAANGMTMRCFLRFALTIQADLYLVFFQTWDSVSTSSKWNVCMKCQWNRWLVSLYLHLDKKARCMAASAHNPASIPLSTALAILFIYFSHPLCTWFAGRVFVQTQGWKFLKNILFGNVISGLTLACARLQITTPLL